MEKKYAIIDLGSNSVRMIIMKVFEDGSYKMVDQVKDMVRLSEGMGEEMTVKPKAILRTIRTLKLFKILLDTHQPHHSYLIATAAVRNAVNQQEFLEKVKVETGLVFTVVSGEEEAHYDYLGVINTINIENCVIVDVGGGSTELVLVENREMKESISFPFGAVILSERYLGKSRSSLLRIKKLEAFILGKFKEVPWLSNAYGLPIVGLGGTARTFAKIDKKRIGFPLLSLHNYQMTRQELMMAYDQVIRTSLPQRKNIEGVGKDRADIIAGGMVPIKVLVEMLGGKDLIISGNGLREGVFFQSYLLSQSPQLERVADVLRHSIDNLLKNYDANLPHCYHVEKLALSIFDQTQKLHGLGLNERKLLSAAALLHDIGNYVDHYNHHNHGCYLVLNSALHGLRNRERVMCALTVRMHRELDFKRDWRSYQMLINKHDYEIIQKLSIFVFIAEKLDRGEYGKVEQVECYTGADTLQMILKSEDSTELAIAAVLKSEKAFRKHFGKKLVVV